MKALVVFAALTLSATAIESGDRSRWLPISKSDLLAIMFEKLNSTPRVQALSDALSAERINPTLDNNARARIDAMSNEVAALVGDTVGVATMGNPPLRVTFAAQGERVHTIRIYVPVVSYRDKQAADRVFANLSSLFARTYPNWPAAKDWPKESLGKSWNAHPSLTNKPVRDSNDLIAKTTIDGITSATFGVPPDLVIYTLTVRPECVPDTRKSDPFRRAIC